VVEEVDGRLHAEYDSKLCDALAKMREEMEEQLRQSHDDTEAFYERKVALLLIFAFSIVNFKKSWVIKLFAAIFIYFFLIIFEHY